jgi:pSer/pThr/pTyr-binding forkhead associated (FHA) protein
MARLTVTSGEGVRTLELARGTTLSVGRDPTNEIALPDERKASRRHCQVLSRPEGGFEVVDLESTNKTRVNGGVVTRKLLSSGDVIEVGLVQIKFEDPEEDARLRALGQQGVCFLEWVSSEKKGQRVLLSSPRTTLGRRESNTVPLQDRMASGHHAEIVKDLNGYTIRDLGSTNGTLVDGEPVTERMLTHGSRVRIGNSRFLFKDPSMKDIEVELAKFDDEDGWGMMADIDLSRARGSPAGLLLALLLLLVAGGGFLFLQQQADEAGKAEPTAGGAGELMADGSFDGDLLLWSAPEGAPVSVSRVAQGSSGHALRVAYSPGGDGGPAMVTYADEFLATAPLRVKAKLRGSGDVRLLGLWVNRADPKKGVTGVQLPVVLGTTEAGSEVERVVVRPAWADAFRLALSVGKGSNATIDDVSVRTAHGATAIKLDCCGFPMGEVEPTGGLDLANERTVLLVGGQPVARTEDGTTLSVFLPEGAPEEQADKSVRVRGALVGGGKSATATITWTLTQEGVLAKVSAEGAKDVGVSALLPRAHLEGQVNVLTRSEAGALPAAAGQGTKGVRETLAGNPAATESRPATLLTFVVPADGPDAALAIEDADDPGLVRLVHWLGGASGALEVVTDFAQQAQRAQEDLESARTLLSSDPGQAIQRLRIVAQKYPFNARVRDDALKLATEREDKALKDLQALDAALAAFRVFRSDETLQDAETKSRALSAEFLVGGGGPVLDDGSIGSQVRERRQAVARLRQQYDAENAVPEVIRLERLAGALTETGGFEATAALFYRAILDRFGGLGSEDTDLGRRLKAIEAKYEELAGRPGVREALPPPPAAPMER